METYTATGVPCSHDEEFCSDHGPENVNSSPESNAALSEKYFVANNKPHDNRFVIPEPVSSRTRRKLQLCKSDGKQVTSTAEVYNEMEPSSEGEEAEIDAAFTRSQMQAMSSVVNDAVSREIACGSRENRVTVIIIIINNY